MSSGKKSSEQANAAVLGRRLRPIYDAIDAGQNKKAIQEADKVLKKHPNTAAARALKALALIRTERNGEAWPLINALEEEVKQGKFDENLLQAMCHCFKEAFVPERIVLLYCSMVEQCPKDEQHLTHLFMAHARVRDYKQQHKVGMALYKEFQYVPYYMWSVMSVIMQAITDPKLGPTMFFPLAEKMMEKIMNGYRLQGEEVDLYLMILEGRNKLTSAIEYLEKEQNFDKTVMPGTSMKYRLNKLYQKDKQHKVVVARSIAALETEYNDWTTWKCLFDSAFELLKIELDQEKQKMVQRLSELCLRAEQSIKNGQQSVRGTLLARLELIDRLLRLNHVQKTGPMDHKLGQPLDSLKQLADCSYTRPYCFADLKCYLHLLSGQQMQQLVDYVRGICDAKCSNSAGNESAGLWCDILKERLTLYSKITSPRSLSTKDADAAVHLLFHKLPKEPQMGQEASAYAQIIANYIWFCHQQLQQQLPLPSNYLLKSIVILEHVLAKYTNCDATVPLLLCRLYAQVGGTRRVAQLCKHLDIKYIQRDSMGYLQCLLGDRYGSFKSAILHYTSLGVFYDQSEREVSECIVNAYKNGHFSQIPKLCEFTQKCSHSMFCAATDVMNRSLSSCFAIDSLEVIAEMLLGENDGRIEWEKVNDNRDFGILASLTAVHSEADLIDVRQDSFDELISTLKLHHFVCRAIGVFSHKEVTQHKFTSILQEFTSHLEHCRLTYEQPIKTANRLEYFANTQIRDLLHGGYFKLPLFVLNLGQTLINKRFGEENVCNSQQNGNSLESVVSILPEVEKLETVIKSFVPTLPDSIQGLQVPAYLEKCAKSLHFIVLSLLGFKLMENMVVSFGWLKCSSKGKKEKTKNFLSEQFSTYTEALTTVLKSLQRDLKQAEERIKSGDYTFKGLESMLENYQDSEELAMTRKTMENSMKCSYTESITEMLKAISRTKEKWLDGSSATSE